MIARNRSDYNKYNENLSQKIISMTKTTDHAQSTAVVLAIGGILIVTGLVVGVVLFGGVFDTSSDGPTQQTVTSGSSLTPTVTQTVYPSPTVTTTVSPTATDSPTTTPMPTLTPTATPTPTDIPTPTPEPVQLEDYEVFLASFVNQLGKKPVVPIRSSGGRVQGDGTLVQVVNLTALSESNITRLREKNGIISAYAQAFLFHEQGKLSGKAPSGLRVLEVNNTDRPPKTFYVNNSVASKFASKQISAREYERQVYKTQRNQTIAERQLAAEIARETTNTTFNG